MHSRMEQTSLLRLHSQCLTSSMPPCAQSMTVHKSKLERDKEAAVAARKADEAARKAARPSALPTGRWGAQVRRALSAVVPCSTAMPGCVVHTCSCEHAVSAGVACG